MECLCLCVAVCLCGFVCVWLPVLIGINGRYDRFDRVISETLANYSSVLIFVWLRTKATCSTDQSPGARHTHQRMKRAQGRARIRKTSRCLESPTIDPWSIISYVWLLFYVLFYFVLLEVLCKGCGECVWGNLTHLLPIRATLPGLDRGIRLALSIASVWCTTSQWRRNVWTDGVNREGGDTCFGCILQSLFALTLSFSFQASSTLHLHINLTNKCRTYR